jgi:triacylglycerol esterase/lipase EstA (alpha/beta hydrolase family)
MELKRARVMTFGYNAGIKSDIAQNLIRIKGIAASLNNALANKRITNEVCLHSFVCYLSLGLLGMEELSRPIVFIGHSMGGLVAKAVRNLFNMIFVYVLTFDSRPLSLLLLLKRTVQTIWTSCFKLLVASFSSAFPTGEAKYSTRLA